MVSCACSGSGLCVAAALSDGRLLVHTLSDAGLSSSGNGKGHLSYRLVADIPLPAAASQLVFLSSLPALALAAACGSRHVPAELLLCSLSLSSLFLKAARLARCRNCQGQPAGPGIHWLCGKSPPK